MRISHFAPGPALGPFVKGYEVVETDAESERTLVPETGFVVGFRFAGSSALLEPRGPREVPAAVVTGLRLTARVMRTSAGGGIVLAKLRETGAARFLEAPLHGLFGETGPLDAVAPPDDVARTLAEVLEARTLDERVAAVERFLLRCGSRRPWRPDPAVEATVHAILSDPGVVRVRAQAAALGVSVDALEKRFRRVVGASPKQRAALVRVRRALELHPSAATLGHLALAAGFYDQAHFNRQLTAMLGASPGAFLTRVEYCMDESP
jgi:AraC-like DNA-binding protein